MERAGRAGLASRKTAAGLSVVDVRAYRKALRREWHLWRAAIVALAVVLQLLGPAVLMRASAQAGQTCLGLTGKANDGPQKAQHHDTQCMHCPNASCSAPLLPTPGDIVASAAAVAIAEPIAQRANQSHAHVRPPPIGPPG